MRFAYADPPYLGCGSYYLEHHPDALIWNDVETHRKLIERLCDEYKDGWALSMSSVNLYEILPLCPKKVRISAWVKPWAAFIPNVNPAYTWEPVIWTGGRKRTREQDTVRDWVAENITMKRGLTGAKPRGFCRWIFQLLNAQKGDQLDDLFPGSGAVSAAWAEWVGERPQLPMLPLEDYA